MWLETHGTSREQRPVDLRTTHTGGFALDRRRARPIPAHAHGAVATSSTDVVALLKGSSMRMMEAGLAIVALATALLIGLGR